MSFSVRVQGPLILMIGLGWTAAAWGAPQAAPALVDEALRFYGHLNSASPLEPAGSHGSIGTDVGAGLVTVLPPEHNALLNRQFGADSDGKSMGIPRLWLVHGLPLPIDAAITATGPGNASTHSFTQISAALQWTVYEAFARPALAVRGSYGKLFGIAGTSLSSAGAEAVASYGLFSYITLYGRVGAMQHRGTLAAPAEQLNGLGLAPSSSDPAIFQQTWIEPVRAAGLRLRFGASKLALTGEVDLGAGLKQADYGAKLSYDL